MQLKPTQPDLLEQSPTSTYASFTNTRPGALIMLWISKISYCTEASEISGLKLNVEDVMAAAQHLEPRSHIFMSNTVPNITRA